MAFTTPCLVRLGVWNRVRGYSRSQIKGDPGLVHLAIVLDSVRFGERPMVRQNKQATGVFHSAYRQFQKRTCNGSVPDTVHSSNQELVPVAGLNPATERCRQAKKPLMAGVGSRAFKAGGFAAKLRQPIQEFAGVGRSLKSAFQSYESLLKIVEGRLVFSLALSSTDPPETSVMSTTAS